MSKLTATDYPLELWGGVECTYNRVGDDYFDQLASSGHEHRISDLDRVAQLGIKTIRYPVLWERVETEGAAQNWKWPDERLQKLRELNINPIAGLLHHGSGPRHTSLLDPAFPQKFSTYAGSVAARYPWLSRYTPINESLTTARFSALYGLWYPHTRETTSFLKALLNECLGTAMAMRAIRAVQPKAELVFTEDLGEVYSTSHMRYQADFENERRWLSLDLLCGSVVPGHPLWSWLQAEGAERAILDDLAANPCPPDIIGMNHYVTSNRFLDERLAKYPPRTHGGNGKDFYADVEAVRVAGIKMATRSSLLRQLWQRYNVPIAVTESHIYAAREEQMRWLKSIWDDAHKLRIEGVPVVAVTLWSLFGTYDWVSLATRNDGIYEPGVFDVRGDQPRPTALAGMARSLTAKGQFMHPALPGLGWWERDIRVLYADGPVKPSKSPKNPFPIRARLAITGSHGTLGTAFARICQFRDLAYVPIGRQDMNLLDAKMVEQFLDRERPWAVIHAAGYVRVDDAESDRERCRQDNVETAITLARACGERNIPFVMFSSDLVFGSSDHIPHVESSPTAPLNFYGITKREAETAVLALNPSALIIRTSAFFGPWDEYNFVTRTLQQLSAHQPVLAADDIWVSPTYVPDLTHRTLDLLIDGEKGIWHLTNEGEITWAELAHKVAKQAGLDTSLITAQGAQAMGWKAPRPTYSVLQSERTPMLGSLDVALSRYFAERQ